MPRIQYRFFPMLYGISFFKMFFLNLSIIGVELGRYCLLNNGRLFSFSTLRIVSSGVDYFLVGGGTPCRAAALVYDKPRVSCAELMDRGHGTRRTFVVTSVFVEMIQFLKVC